MAAKDPVPKKLRKIVGLARRIVADPPDRPALVSELARIYRGLDREERNRLFPLIVRELELPPERVRPALRETLRELERHPERWPVHLAELRRRLVSPLHEFLEGFLDAPTGLQVLIQGRADILEAQREGVEDLEPLEQEIADLLNGWFGHGLLEVREIDESSPWRLIRYLREHEMVHPMDTLEEMGLRLGPGRRCFGLFHKAMPAEPVVFVEVALTRGLATSIHRILGPDAESPAESPDTAIFYSINATQNGLSGLGLGKVLIFRVTEALRADTPGLKTFATLSPMPRFWPRYLRPILAGEPVNATLTARRIGELFSPRAVEELRREFELRGGPAVTSTPALLLEILSDPTWIQSATFRRLLRKPLRDVAFHYLSRERDHHGRPLCPVAGFHLGNGAVVARKYVRFAANTTPRGLSESCGLMVNYLYSERWHQSLRRSLGL